jgi:HlyD family secretion protein
MKPRQLGWLLVMIAAAALASTGVYYAHRDEGDMEITKAAISRGDVVETVTAIGTLEATVTVPVGAQVTGIVRSLHADFNSIVHKGDLLAQIDPAVLQTQEAQARANVTRAEAEVERLRVIRANAGTEWDRARRLAARALLAPADLEAARIACRSADAQIAAAQAQVKQALASLQQVRTDLDRTAIRSPIDGIVVSRSVDVGQTVSARLQAPTLFLVAADLTAMRMTANVDEADVGRIRKGQAVTFRVDAFPDQTFAGHLAQVRLQPILNQNAVSYAIVADVHNPRLELRPGMTAMLSIETSRHADVLRVPNVALLFRPSEEMFADLGQKPPSLAGPRPPGRVWVMADRQLRPVRLQIGASDGVYTVVQRGELQEGTEVVTAIRTASELRPTPVLNNPLIGPQRRWRHFH